jgi:hypothetical protein
MSTEESTEQKPLKRVKTCSPKKDEGLEPLPEWLAGKSPILLKPNQFPEIFALLHKYHKSKENEEVHKKWRNQVKISMWFQDRFDEEPEQFIGAISNYPEIVTGKSSLPPSVLENKTRGQWPPEYDVKVKLPEYRFAKTFTLVPIGEQRYYSVDNGTIYYAERVEEEEKKKTTITE